METTSPTVRWLNRTVLGVGLASLFSDWSHETATAVLPAYLAAMGASAAWLGAIEGVADGLSSFAKITSGVYTDTWRRRKPLAVVGYAVTALGTASFGLATTAWQVMLGRAGAWLGRGARTPVRKALLAAAVTRETYGRAFGFERMMDTVGAIAGPVTAWGLLHWLGRSYRELFFLTLIPGLAGAALIGFLVKEPERTPGRAMPFGERLRSFSGVFRRFLGGVGLFGVGAFSHTLLILLAMRELAPSMGATGAAAAAAGLYALHNVCGAAFALVGGRLADRFPKSRLLAGGYLTAAAMCLCIIFAPANLGSMALIFALGGANAGLEETLEDSLCAELVEREHHGTGFGVLATVNGVGDFLSSIIVGALWTAAGKGAAFGFSAALSVAGAALIFFAGKAE